MGLVYKNIGNYSEALVYYERALQIRQKALPENDLSLASSYKKHRLRVSQVK